MRPRRHVRLPPDLTSLFDVLFIVVFAALTVPRLSRALNAWQLNADARSIGGARLSAKMKAASQETEIRKQIVWPQSTVTIELLGQLRPSDLLYWRSLF